MMVFIQMPMDMKLFQSVLKTGKDGENSQNKSVMRPCNYSVALNNLKRDKFMMEVLAIKTVRKFTLQSHSRNITDV